MGKYLLQTAVPLNYTVHDIERKRASEHCVCVCGVGPLGWEINFWLLCENKYKTILSFAFSL